MDYEKKYKNLVAKIKNAYLYAQTDSTKAVLESIFPELAESEDERIRKEILDFIQLCLSRTDFGSRSIALRKEDAEIFEKWIAYLEKRKEPNYCHHEVDLSGCSEEYSKGYYDGWNNCNQQHSQLEAEQKPTEWGEEDERIRLACIATINDVIDYERDRWEDYNPGKPYRPITKYDEQIDWLKSPRPQSHWKPSEEQMDELEKVSSGNTCAFNYGILRELYDNLKKL